MKSEILVIAEAILANTQVLKMLVEKLPAAAQAEVAKVVNPTPAATVVATVPAAESPVTVPVAAPAPVVAAPVPTPTPAPVVADPVPVVTPAPTAGAAPFTDQKGLVEYIMAAYKTLGPIKGATIQGVLNELGLANINDVKPELYAALYAGVEKLKASA
jgi:hypothetical protein